MKGGSVFRNAESGAREKEEDTTIMSHGHHTPGPETEPASQPAINEPMAWTPPVSHDPVPTSFNPRASMPRPMPTPAQPVQAEPHMPQAYAQAYAPDPYSQPAYPQPDYAPAAPASFAAMGQPQPEAWGYPPAAAGYDDPYAAAPYAAPPTHEMAEDPITETKGRSLFRRKPKNKTAKPDKTPKSGRKAKKAKKGGLIQPTLPDGSVETTAATGSSGKPFVMGVLTGIVMMLGVGFLLGGEPEPIPDRYAPDPLAESADAPDGSLAFADVDEASE